MISLARSGQLPFLGSYHGAAASVSEETSIRAAFSDMSAQTSSWLLRRDPAVRSDSVTWGAMRAQPREKCAGLALEKSADSAGQRPDSTQDTGNTTVLWAGSSTVRFRMRSLARGFPTPVGIDSRYKDEFMQAQFNFQLHEHAPTHRLRLAGKERCRGE